MSDNQSAIRASEAMWDAEDALRQQAKKTTPYRFIRAIQLGRSCPGIGKSCVETTECACMKIAMRFQP